MLVLLALGHILTLSSSYVFPWWFHKGEFLCEGDVTKGICLWLGLFFFFNYNGFKHNKIIMNTSVPIPTFNKC